MPGWTTYISSHKCVRGVWGGKGEANQSLGISEQVSLRSLAEPNLWSLSCYGYWHGLNTGEPVTLLPISASESTNYYIICPFGTQFCRVIWVLGGMIGLGGLNFLFQSFMPIWWLLQWYLSQLNWVPCILFNILLEGFKSQSNIWWSISVHLRGI